MTDTPSPTAAEAATEREEVLAVLEPFARKADAVSLSEALGHIERAHLMAARDLAMELHAIDNALFLNEAADTIAALRQERNEAQYLLKRMKEARAQSPDWEKLWAEQSTRAEHAEEQVEQLTRERDDLVDTLQRTYERLAEAHAERDEAQRSYRKAADERNAAERRADRYKALAEGERERCAIALEEQFYCRHYLINALRALPAPSLPGSAQPTNKDPPHCEEAG